MLLLGEPALDLGPALCGGGRVVGFRRPACATTTSPSPSCATRWGRPPLAPVYSASVLECGLLPEPPLRGLHELEHRDRQPWFHPRKARPNAAVDFPLPSPVCTMSSGRLRRWRVVSPSSGTNERLSLRHQGALVGCSGYMR